MKKQFWIISLFTFLLTTSCKESWCGEKDLGNRFTLVSDKPIQIIFCTTNATCCDSGWTGVPGGVTEYGFNKKWIIAKRSENDYWIIDKDFEIDLTGFDIPGRYKFYQSHLRGNLTKLEFDKMKDSLDIRVEFKKVE